MGSVDRALARADRRARRTLQDLGDIARETRVAADVSQGAVGRAVGMSVSQISRFERGRLETASIVQATRILGALGLDVRANAYPGGEALRDEASARRLGRIIGHVRPPLTYRVDVPLPGRADGPVELRAWDLVTYRLGERCAWELEMRLRDAQATIRRHSLKRRDDPVERFVLVLADTKSNRRVLREHLDLFPGLPVLRKSVVFAALERGEHPPSGILLG